MGNNTCCNDTISYNADRFDSLVSIIDSQNAKIEKNSQDMKLILKGLSQRIKSSEDKLDKMIAFLGNDWNKKRGDTIVKSGDHRKSDLPCGCEPNLPSKLYNRIDDLEAKMCYMINELAFFRSRKYHSATMHSRSNDEMRRMELENPTFRKDMHSYYNMTKNYQMYSLDKKVLNHNVANRGDPFNRN